MDNSKMLLIINPRSGVRSKAGLASKLEKRLRGHGFEVDTAYTRHAGHATTLAAEAASNGYGSVAVCGGDGTVNEAAAGLFGTGVPMAIIPSGSGNGLARHLEIPIDEMHAADLCAQRHILECDCGMVNGRLFFCTFGLGFDASVSHRFAHQGTRGRMTYIKSAFEEFAHYQPQHYAIAIDGGEPVETDAFLVACCNASQYGNNAFIAPGASVRDGLLDIVVIRGGNTPQMLLAGLDMLTGMIPHNHHIDTVRGRNATIRFDGTAYAHIDGEPTQIEGCAHVKCLPKGLKLYCNPAKKHFTPFITPIDLTLRDWGLAIEKIFR